MSKRVNLNAVVLDGTNDYVLVSDQDAFSFTDDTSDKPFSISVWVFVGDVGSDNGPFISKADFTGDGPGPAKSEWLFKQASGEVRFFLYDNGGSLSGDSIRAQANAATLTSNTWHHVVATYDGSGNQSGINMYTDGTITAAAKTATNSGGGHGNGYVCMKSSVTAVAIGATVDGGINSTAARVFEDKLADICLFNKELSAAEVLELYNGGHVKNMLKATTYGDLISWWKMGDDLDTIATGGIRDYVSGFNGSVQNGATIGAVPALPTDRIKPEGFIHSSYGRTRQPKNVAGDHQVYIHGGVGGNMPTAAPTTATQGYATENQRFLQVYWKADQTNTTHTVTAWGYSHASQVWSELYDTAGTQVRLTTTNAAVETFRVFEVAGVDRVYFRQSDDALAATDLFAAATSTF